MNKIYTKSIRCISWITYKTGIFAEIENSDRDKSLNVFVIEDNEETRAVYKLYKDITALQSEMSVNLIEFDNIVKKYKRMCSSRR